MYRLFVIFIDIAVIGLLIAIIIIKGLPQSDDDKLTFLFIFIPAMLNVTYILFSKTDKESWFNLYFKRKVLEEKKKIQILQNEK